MNKYIPLYNQETVNIFEDLKDSIPHKYRKIGTVSYNTYRYSFNGKELDAEGVAVSLYRNRIIVVFCSSAP